MIENLRDYLDFAVEMAWQAGQLTLGYYQTGIRPDFNGLRSLCVISQGDTRHPQDTGLFLDPTGVG